MKSSAWILLSGGLITLVLTPGACGGGGTTSTTTGTGGASASSSVASSSAVATGMGGTTTTAAACDPPPVPPSQGACYVVPPPPPPPACPHDADGGPSSGSSGSAGAGGAGGAGGSTTASASSGAGGGFTCDTAFPKPNLCGACTEKTCCVELTACDAIPSCLQCVLGTATDPSICNAADIQSAIATLDACANGCCDLDCDPPPVPCNPVSNAPCGTGTCDVGMGGMGYQCYIEPTAAGLCEMCDESSGLFCSGGSACLPDGGCAKYCCDDGDCGSGRCDMTTLPAAPGVGVCLHK
jgi:hypothetical protein